ncbi:hypothetical protein AB434_3673 [Heyndrickxia coagulans]|uniref:Uncharacterized protein n=1 Tax=Heyndrickxia coagulans TaxID=1398 RepID=A0AAN0WBJ4_HEYCO|nr:hypothetical protein SB48_HM08orf02515 [Heyndrickxia coagulans]AKN56078.1 hypothetical protein AB434_3673 [Heyndrickxia coagulans]KYC61741.1 hypothetical protein B4100_2880 [Heyndrickxia coagulans]KYC91906.1 hypothetical protein B4096_2861 [Heyndrickxia coagulans]
MSRFLSISLPVQYCCEKAIQVIYGCCGLFAIIKTPIASYSVNDIFIGIWRN